MNEYVRPTETEYQSCFNKSQILIHDIIKTLKIDILQVTFDKVIEFFEKEFNILFIYLDSKTACGDSCFMKHNYTRNNQIKHYNHIFCEFCTGMTYHDSSFDRYVVYINNDVPKSRMIFTILHELVHIYFHIQNKLYDTIFISKYAFNDSSSYPKAVIPFENEANTIASILFINDSILMDYIKDLKSFKEIMELTNISQSALHNRLMNFLIYNLGLSEKYALGLVIDYKKNNMENTFMFKRLILKHLNC